MAHRTGRLHQIAFRGMEQTQHLMGIEMVRIGGENAPAELHRLPGLALLVQQQGTGKQVGNIRRLRETIDLPSKRQQTL